MDKAINDATKKQAGTFYQYLIALKDCFELNDTDTLQIEVNGDVSIINSTGGLFQKEVKHHFGRASLSDRDEDFWKTLANWYVDYARVKGFSHYILSTTAAIGATSSFKDWNSIDSKEKLKRLKHIGADIKKNEKIFREQYNRIFNNSYDEDQLLSILKRFEIKSAQTTLVGISNEFSRYVGHIPSENRDRYIGAMLGEILIKVKDPPHKWEVTKPEFDRITQKQTAAYAHEGSVPLPTEYAKAKIPKELIPVLEEKRFVKAIQEINLDEVILSAKSDYWKADMTIARYFQDDPLYLESLDLYMDDITSKLGYAKMSSKIASSRLSQIERLMNSQQLYLDVMQWDAKDFGSIIRNQGFFQRGVIQNIVDETDFRWEVGEKTDEHQQD